MTKFERVLLWVLIGVVVILGAITLTRGGSSDNLAGGGGPNLNTQWSFDEGIAVDNTEIINGTGGANFNDEVRAALVEKGNLVTLTATSTAQTLTAAQVCNSNVIRWDVTTVSSSLTLPSATTLAADCLTANGDYVEFLFDATSASTTVVTVTAGAGIDLIGPGTGDDLIDNAKQARISVWRVSASAMYAEVEELLAAD